VKSLEQLRSDARRKWQAYADLQIAETCDLALFLGGSPDSFTGMLLLLFEKADAGNRAMLASVFVEPYALWAIWHALDPAPTFAELQVIRDILAS